MRGIPPRFHRALLRADQANPQRAGAVNGRIPGGGGLRRCPWVAHRHAASATGSRVGGAEAGPCWRRRGRPCDFEDLRRQAAHADVGMLEQAGLAGVAERADEPEPHAGDLQRIHRHLPELLDAGSPRRYREGDRALHRKGPGLFGQRRGTRIAAHAGPRLRTDHLGTDLRRVADLQEHSGREDQPRPQPLSGAGLGLRLLVQARHGARARRGWREGRQGQCHARRPAGGQSDRGALPPLPGRRHICVERADLGHPEGHRVSPAGAQELPRHELAGGIGHRQGVASPRLRGVHAGVQPEVPRVARRPAPPRRHPEAGPRAGQGRARCLCGGLVAPGEGRDPEDPRGHRCVLHHIEVWGFVHSLVGRRKRPWTGGPPSERFDRHEADDRECASAPSQHPDPHRLALVGC
mmetsp:Transcript_125705/g.361386  ORF Transcript_125705/g.361386 Transcript_125705/m.361386 type:complete len:408 (+) Transcript_125705:3885-5108(+)